MVMLHMYYGIEYGSYLQHLHMSGRETDNMQQEGMNLRLEGFFPLIRMKPGSYLGERTEIRNLLL